jgi:hypothetical protein
MSVHAEDGQEVTRAKEILKNGGAEEIPIPAKLRFPTALAPDEHQRVVMGFLVCLNPSLPESFVARITFDNSSRTIPAFRSLR